jgi:hypothetical protein
MLNHAASLLALRNRLLTLSVETTGPISLSATTTGYARAAATGTVSASAGIATFSTSQSGVIANGGTISVAGKIYLVSAFDGTTACVLSGAPTFSASAFTVSFLADGFAPGMEITPLGFVSNPVDVITLVMALSITTRTTRTAEAAAASRSLSAKAPSGIAFENVSFDPIPGRPWLQEQYVPATLTRMTVSSDGGHADESGLYVLTYYGLAGVGSLAILRVTDAILALFAPGTAVTDGASTIVVRGNPGPWGGQIIPQDDGYARRVVTIPWQAFTRIPVAA